MLKSMNAINLFNGHVEYSSRILGTEFKRSLRNYVGVKLRVPSRVIRCASDSRIKRSDIDPRLISYSKGIDTEFVYDVKYIETVRVILENSDREILRGAEDRVLHDLRKYSRSHNASNQKPNRFIKYGDNETLAYLHTHANIALCCVRSTLEELALRLKQFSPENVLDAGFGPGLALLSSRQIWNSVNSGTSVCRNSSMLRLASEIEAYYHPMKKNIIYTNALPKSSKYEKNYDLVVASYSISTIMNPLKRDFFVKDLWSLTKKVLVLVEFGTQFGFECINRAKEILTRDNQKRNLDERAISIAPDPHNNTTPESFNHEYYIFRRKLLVPRALKKPLSLFLNNDSNEIKYSYLIVVRGTLPEKNEFLCDLIEKSIINQDPLLLSNVENIDIDNASFYWPRILSKRKKSPTDIILKLSTPQGNIVDLHLSSKNNTDKIVLLIARSSKPGGLWPIPSMLTEKNF